VEAGSVELQVLKGSLTLNTFRLSDGREQKLKNVTLREGESRRLAWKQK
jgi:hypothetical protein